MEIAKAAVNAPLPPEWEEFEDDSGEVLFYNAITKKTSEHHPLDAYFLELVRQRRAVRAAEAAANGGTDGRRRLRFSRRFIYVFKTLETLTFFCFTLNPPKF